MKEYLLLALIFISGCVGNDIVKEGPFLVTNIVDGDTLDLDNGDRIRLSGINTPERGECYYDEASNMLKELTYEKNVFIEEDRGDEGKYGRKLRYIYVNDSFVNGIMVKEGYGKVYDKYKKETKRYAQLKDLERNAIRNKLGVWSCENIKKDCLFVGSVNSDKYHTSDCKYAKKILPENLKCFKSELELEGKEFSGC